MKIERVGVLGMGLMGSGIAQVAAAAGYATSVVEVDQKFIDRGLGMIAKNLARQVEKGALTTEESDKIQARLAPSTDLAAFADCDIVRS